MIHSQLSAITCVLFVVCSSAESSERSCFIPPLKDLVVGDRSLSPYEFQPSEFASLYDRTAVEVEAYRYRWSWDRYQVKGMFVSLRSMLK